MRRAVTTVCAGGALALILLAACVGRTVDPVPAAPPAPAVAIFGGQVVDPRSDGPPRRETILIEGDRIARLGPDIRVPPHARIVDASGHYVVPGLWDMHAHIAAIGETGDALEDYVAHGVLGIRDMGGRADEILTLKADVAAGRRLGPTIVAAGPTLNGEASADFHRVVRNADEAAETVRDLRARGVDFIKIHRRTSPDALRGAVAQGRREGLFIVGHVPLAMSWIEGSDAGMRSIEHIQTIVENEVAPGTDPVQATFDAMARLEGEHGDKIFRTMARNRTYWTPTLVYFENSWASDPPERRALKQRLYARMAPLVRKAWRAGVPILAGTDMMERRGEWLLSELERLAGLGLSTRAVLATATTDAHALIGRGPGPIEPGGEASFLIVSGDPFADIRNLRRCERVVLRGRLLDCQAHLF